MTLQLQQLAKKTCYDTVRKESMKGNVSSAQKLLPGYVDASLSARVGEQRHPGGPLEGKGGQGDL